MKSCPSILLITNLSCFCVVSCIRVHALQIPRVNAHTIMEKWLQSCRGQWNTWKITCNRHWNLKIIFFCRIWRAHNQGDVPTNQTNLRKGEIRSSYSHDLDWNWSFIINGWMENCLSGLLPFVALDTPYIYNFNTHPTLTHLIHSQFNIGRLSRADRHR